MGGAAKGAEQVELSADLGQLLLLRNGGSAGLSHALDAGFVLGESIALLFGHLQLGVNLLRFRQLVCRQRTFLTRSHVLDALQLGLQGVDVVLGISACLEIHVSNNWRCNAFFFARHNLGCFNCLTSYILWFICFLLSCCNICLCICRICDRCNIE